MKRQMTRFSVALLVMLTTILAAKLWSLSYERNPDPKALFKIEAVQVKRDRDNRWLEIHLKHTGGKEHDLSKPILLVTKDGTQHKTADIAFAGTAETGFSEIWPKYWLEASDLNQTLELHLNGGILNVKTNRDAPILENGAEKVFKSANWQRSWLGF